MAASMQLLVEEVERVQLYNHNQTELTADIKETVGKSLQPISEFGHKLRNLES